MSVCKKQLIVQSNAETFPRIERVECGWCKRAEPGRKNPWRPVLRVVTTLIPWPMLRSTATTGDDKSVRTEAGRLQTWRKAGLPVPELLEVTAGYIIIADVGTPLRNWLRAETDPEHRLDAVKLATINLGVIHRSGFCHGRPFLKDIIYDGSHIRFIDLEEEPEKIMSLATAQARDLMLFIMSCAASFGNHHPIEDLRALINIYWQTNPSHQVQRVMRRNVNAIYLLTFPLRLLPQRFLGRDARQALRGLAVLRQCSS